MKHALRFLAVGLIVFTALVAVNRPTTEAKSNEVAEIKRPYLIEIIPANNDPVSEVTGSSLADNAFDISQELGANPFEEDKFQVFPELKMGIGGKITLYRAPDYLIVDGKKSYTVRSWTHTVGELLTEQNVEMGADDKLSFARDFEITSGMTVTIIRVARTMVTESQAIDYKIIKKDDPALDRGKTRVAQAGKKGSKNLIYEVIREDGIQISKTLKRTEKVADPVDEIIMVGTKPVITVACKFNDLVIDAAAKNNQDPNALCTRMMRESRGNPSSDGGQYKGLFQYDPGFWESVSAKAGYGGASIWDAKAQIYTTAWAWSHGYRSRWPSS